MSDERMDNIFYVCTVIEYVSRITHNRPKDIVAKLTKEDIEHQIKVANVNHCLSYEQIADEWIEDFNIEDGNYFNVEECKYEVPSHIAIGRVYQQLILRETQEGKEVQTLIDVFSSFISDEISNYNSNVYYSNPDYIRCSYEAGMLLD